MHPLSDRHLAQRLERTEGRANAAFVDARAALEPVVGATWTRVAGAYVLFDGVGSPLTQTFGLGLDGDAADNDLDRIEGFFRSRGASIFHEVSPLAGVHTLRALHARGYAPIELTSVMCQPIAADDRPTRSRVLVRAMEPEDGERWAEIAAEGWSSESPQLVAFVRGIGRVSVRARGTTAFLATLDDRPVAAAALSIHHGTALLAGASTIPSARRQGAQQALLHARLAFARAQGCDLAMMCAAPGSASQRNAERNDFRIAYTRMKWELS